jgi:hypothetical protein
VGSIASDSALNHTVPCDPVTIEARIDWERSPPLTVDATPERTLEIEVANGLGPLYLPYLWPFGRRPYLVLRQLTTRGHVARTDLASTSLHQAVPSHSQLAPVAAHLRLWATSLALP